MTEYTVDLLKIDGDGSFPCPKCGNKIDPSDETEESYTVVGDATNNELIVRCNRCGSTIKLVGFEILGQADFGLD